METYHGHVRTPADAIILFEACRLGSLPRVQRRLSEKERQSIKSGSVFVWDEREAGMRRWTDGKSWSASRVSGSFLTYREMEGKRGGSNFGGPRAGKTPDSARGSDSDMDMGGDDGPDGYRYKPDGLMKQSFSITTTTGNHLHLISYYSRSHPTSQNLMQPSTDPNLRHIRPQKGMYPESTVHEQQSIPAVTRSPMAGHLPVNMPQQMAGAYGGRPGALPTHPLAFSHPQQFNGPWAGPPATAGYQPYPPGAAAPPPPMGYSLHHQAQYAQPLPPLSQPAVTSAPNDNYGRPPQMHHRTSSGSAYQPYGNGRSPHTGIATLAPPHPVSQHTSRNNSPASTPPMPQIDPRLMAGSPRVNGQSLPPVRHDSSTRTPSPAPLKRDYSGTPVSRDGTASNASTIPSIGALMNGSDERSGKRSRSSSRSPGGSRREGQGPHDIPHEKLGFREDMRALRVLDRAFKT
ncbi:MAG: hypothetical protein MMC23_008474 [Stictis urceolatum]|nr:hypothetical protein [Stictis urceolata]